MKKAWFTRNGRIFKPLSLYGWLITAAALIYVGFSVLRILRLSLKLNQTLVEIAFQVTITAVVYILIAYFTQERNSN